MAEIDRIRVLIVDDHGIVRKGLAAYLRHVADIELVGEAGDGQEAVDLCADIRPDVVLMDLLMPEMGGVAATRIIRRRWSRMQVIALTSFQDKELVQEVLQAGAISYLLKNVSGEDLAEAIRAAHAGRSVLAPEAVQALIQPGKSKPFPDYDLTPREREVLSLLTKGLSNPEIADRLGISPSTAKAHVSNILSKMGVSSRAEAISVALQQNLVP
jgi:NarL family two-component system response regulator LiaR